MVTRYKLTDENNQTHGGYQWGDGVEHTSSGEYDVHSIFVPEDLIEVYAHPLLAILLNPVHAGFKNPHLWLVDCDVRVTDSGLRETCTRCKTIRRISLPEVTTAQHIAFGILCAKAVFPELASATFTDNLFTDDVLTKEAEAWLVRRSDWKLEGLKWARHAVVEPRAKARSAARAAQAAARQGGKTLDLVALAKQAVPSA